MIETETVSLTAAAVIVGVNAGLVALFLAIALADRLAEIRNGGRAK